jgi:hypothetical protein
MLGNLIKNGDYRFKLDLELKGGKIYKMGTKKLCMIRKGKNHNNYLNNQPRYQSLWLQGNVY